MNEEEFDEFTNSLDRELDKEIKRQNLFIQTLESELIEVGFKYFPECELRRNEITKQIKGEVHECALMMSELIEYLICLKPDDSEENPEQYAIPYPTEIEDDEFERRKIEFKFSCHEKVKEVVTKLFPELADLSGNAIRNINFTAYCSILNFVIGFIYLVDRL